MELGRPEYYHDNIELRLLSINRAIAQYQFSSSQLKKEFEDKIDQHTVLFIKGFGNEINLLSSFRELFFNSRELLDYTLTKIHNKTTATNIQTAKSFLPFAKHLMKNEYDQIGLPIINFYKTNITYIFHIRKIRNQIKNCPSSIKFRFITDHFESYIDLPIDNNEKDLIPFLDINQKEKALTDLSYEGVHNLDILFPEVPLFWKTCFSIIEKDPTTNLNVRN
jgi:hypothetical protein